jgi:hypothetical protein
MLELFERHPTRDNLGLHAQALAHRGDYQGELYARMVDPAETFASDESSPFPPMHEVRAWVGIASCKEILGLPGTAHARRQARRCHRDMRKHPLISQIFEYAEEAPIGGWDTAVWDLADSGTPAFSAAAARGSTSCPDHP